MRSTMTIMALATLMTAAPALAGDPAPAAAPAAAEDTAKSKLICRKSTDTGTRLKARRICYTAEQWTTVNRQAREQLKESRGAASTGGN